MRRLLIAAGGAVGLFVLAGAGPAAASCASSTATGTIVGGIGGALIGGAIGHTPGAFIGGVGGAVVGHEIGRSSCRHYRYGYRYYHRRYDSRYDGRYDGRYDTGQAPAAYQEPGLYYDPEGRPIHVTPEGYAAGYGQPAAGYRATAGYPQGGAYGQPTGACRNEDRQYYDATGTLVQRTVQVCDR